MPMLASEELIFTYRVGGTNIINGLSVRIAPGSFVVVIGPNGSGKSTLAKHCNALLLPSGGRFRVMDMDSSDVNFTYAIRQTVGLVFQNPDNQMVASVVEEDVAFGLCNLGLPSEEIHKRVDEALKAVGLENCRTQPVHTLSGGQMQRVAIAGIVAMRPKCIVLDEATAMLDSEGREEVWAVLKGLQADHGITVVWITHHMEEAVRADRVLVLAQGQLALDGTPAQVFAQVDRLKDVGLEPPPLAELMYELARAGCPVSLDLPDVETCAGIICDLLAKGGVGAGKSDTGNRKSGLCL